jgi:hypothetical protein
VQAIVEHKDASEAQRSITEIYSGIMAVPSARLKAWLARQPVSKNLRAERTAAAPPSHLMASIDHFLLLCLFLSYYCIQVLVLLWPSSLLATHRPRAAPSFTFIHSFIPRSRSSLPTAAEKAYSEPHALRSFYRFSL